MTPSAASSSHESAKSAGAAAPTLDPVAYIEELGRKARAAAAKLMSINPGVKNAALKAMADALLARSEAILAANRIDLENGRKAGLKASMLDRLELNPKRLEAMAKAILEVAALPDPVGEITEMKVRPNGLQVGRMRVPIGVVGFIYEARPNVTTDAAALCIKSGNAVILRGGKEALESNRVIGEALDEAGRAAGLPEGCVQILGSADRALVGALLKANQWIDVIIPRGGKDLIKRVMEESTIPVIKHYDGNCFIFVERTADLDRAVEIILNAKVQRPGVCNALESVLVDSAVAEKFLPKVIAALRAKNVEIRGDERVRAAAPAGAEVKAATEDDWYAEYLDLILAMKVVDSLDEAIGFINKYGSHHTDAILTNDYTLAMRFVRGIDSACVHVNCSTRFSDGGEYGLGAEIGISTEKLHARGPMGLTELCTYKWVVFGSGQIRT